VAENVDNPEIHLNQPFGQEAERRRVAGQERPTTGPLTPCSVRLLASHTNGSLADILLPLDLGDHVLDVHDVDHLRRLACEQASREGCVQGVAG
jgi:hypothetical protein